VRIVISYAREDRRVVDELVGTLRMLNHDPWTDAGAHSGHRWWDEIVQRIQKCDALLAVTSPASLASKACTLERHYASALNKALLPVMVVPVTMSTLPAEFAKIQFFDFTVRDSYATGRLYQALAQLPPPGPLPSPLPPPPPPPLSYLNDIADQLVALPADLDRQHRIVTALINGLRSPDSEERMTATELIRGYLSHPHRLHDPADRAAEALSRLAGGGPDRRAPNSGPPPPPARRSRSVTVLAWIGGLTLVLLGLAIWAVASNANGGAATVPAAVVSQSVYNDLLSKGVQPFGVTCGDLKVEVGATTYCATPGLPSAGSTVRVTSVQGSVISTWEYLPA
jgi:hypothetical protein